MSCPLARSLLSNNRSSPPLLSLPLKSVVTKKTTSFFGHVFPSLSPPRKESSPGILVRHVANPGEHLRFANHSIIAEFPSCVGALGTGSRCLIGDTREGNQKGLWGAPDQLALFSSFHPRNALRTGPEISEGKRDPECRHGRGSN